MSRRPGRHRTDNHLTVLHHRVADETTTALLCPGLCERDGHAVGGRGVRVVCAALAMKVARAIAPRVGGSPEPSLGRKLLRLAQASSKCRRPRSELDSNPLTLSCTKATEARNRAAASPSNSRVAVLVKVAASHTASSLPSPTNQRNSRSVSIRSTNCHSERIE